MSVYVHGMFRVICAFSCCFVAVGAVETLGLQDATKEAGWTVMDMLGKCTKKNAGEDHVREL